MERRRIGSLVGCFAGIIFKPLARRIDVDALKTGIQAADGTALVALQFLEPAEGRDAKIRRLDILR
jgi:hypothetical protein